RRWLLVPVALATVWYDVDLVRAFRAFNRSAAGLHQIVALIPRHASVLTLMVPPTGDPSVNVNAFNQFPSYVQIEHGGYNFYNFSEGFPLRYKTYRPAPNWARAQEFVFAEHSAGWDYFLTFHEGIWHTPLREATVTGKVELVAE